MCIMIKLSQINHILLQLINLPLQLDIDWAILTHGCDMV